VSASYVIIHLYTNFDRTQFSQLPLPHLKVGYLTAPPAGAIVAPHNDWKRSEFLLDHEKLQQVMYLTDTLKIFKRLLTLKF
jgi:hypothetical protein